MLNDNEYIRDVTERYIHEVTRRLPEAQRADIEKELRTLIEDMLSARTDAPGRADIDAVLTELGKPWQLADRYLEKKNYLIGPAYFETYQLVLKIVLGATAFGITVALLIGMITNPPAGVGAAFAGFIGSFLVAMLQVFAFVTIGFAIAERCEKQPSENGTETWRPKDLPPVPASGAFIPRSDPIAGMVFTVLAIILFNAAPGIFAIYLVDGTASVTPIFDLAVLRSMLPLLNTIFILGLVRELFKLIIGRHCFRLAVINIILHTASLVLTVFFLTNTAIWNTDLTEAIRSIEFLRIPADYDFAFFPDTVVSVILGIAIFGFIVESISYLVKAARFGVR